LLTKKRPKEGQRTGARRGGRSGAGGKDLVKESYRGKRKVWLVVEGGGNHDREWPYWGENCSKKKDEKKGGRETGFRNNQKKKKPSLRKKWEGIERRPRRGRKG